MGYVKHDALIVTCYEEDVVKRFHKKCIKLFGSAVSEISESKANSYFSFCVMTSGSKSGWETKQDWEEGCEKFFEYVRKQRRKIFSETGKKLFLCDAVHVTYGGDDDATSTESIEDF